MIDRQLRQTCSQIFLHDQACIRRIGVCTITHFEEQSQSTSEHNNAAMALRLPQ